MDITQQHILRHHIGEVRQLAEALNATPPADMVRLTTHQALEMLDPAIQAHLANGTTWTTLEAWFKYRGYADVTELVYREYRAQQSS